MAEQHDEGGGDAGQREAVDRLADNQRVLVEARMLPTARPLTPEEITGVRDAFVAYLAANPEIPAAQVAREIKYSDSVISGWQKGVYKGDVQKVTVAINNWLERDARRRRGRLPDGYVKTWVAETIKSITETCHKRCMMGAIIAPSGSGKTMVLKVLAQEMRGLYVYCDADMSGREFLLALATALGGRGIDATKAALKRYIIAELSNTRRIILLDEAHLLGKTITSLRSIHDQANVAIVMCGTADILRFVNDRADGRGQFSSRTIQYNLLDDVRNAEGPEGGRGTAGRGRDLFTEEEIKQFFASKRIRLAPDALHLFWRLACLPNHGTLRLVSKLTEIALDFVAEGEVIKRQDVVDALTILHNTLSRQLLQLAEREPAASAKATRVA